MPDLDSTAINTKAEGGRSATTCSPVEVPVFRTADELSVKNLAGMLRISGDIAALGEAWCLQPLWERDPDGTIRLLSVSVVYLGGLPDDEANAQALASEGLPSAPCSRLPEPPKDDV